MKSDVENQVNGSWKNETANFRIVRVELLPVEHHTEHCPEKMIKTQLKETATLSVKCKAASLENASAL